MGQLPWKIVDLLVTMAHHMHPVDPAPLPTTLAANIAVVPGKVGLRRVPIIMRITTLADCHCGLGS